MERTIRMVIIDLFSGIGGFSLAGHWVGWETGLFCEIEEFPRQVLAKNFPGVYIHGDVHTLNGDIIKRVLQEKIGAFNADELILTGGFPCQPFSQAGKRKGGEDERAISPEILRILQEIRPKWAVLENVYGIITQQDGEYFESEVISQLENIGYTVQPYIIPASAVGAWHRRDRVWFVCRRNDVKDTFCIRCNSSFGEKAPNIRGFGEFSSGIYDRLHREQINSNNNGKGLQGCRHQSAEQTILEENRTQFDNCSFTNSDNSRERASGSGNDSNRQEKSQERKFSRSKFGRHYIAENSNDSGMRGRYNGNTTGSISEIQITRPDSRITPDTSVWNDRGYIGEQESGQTSQLGNSFEQRTSADTRCFGQKEYEKQTTGIKQCCESSADCNLTGLQGRQYKIGREGQESNDKQFISCGGMWDTHWYEYALATCIRGMVDGVPEELHKLETTDRVGRLKALGNAIVPQVAYQIFLTIQEIENHGKEKRIKRIN